jgi:WD40 repeat protein
MRRISCLAIIAGWSLTLAPHPHADVVTEPLRKFGLGDSQVVAISPDGKWMATGGSSGAFLWDYQSGTMVHRLERHQAAVTALCFLPSGVLLTAGRDATIRAWDTASAKELRSFAGHAGAIFDLSFAPDGQTFVSVGDTTVRVWSFDTGKLLHTFSFPGEGVSQARFAPDGKRLVTSHLVFTNVVDSLQLWDLDTERTIRSFGGDGWVQKLEFVGGGQLVTAKGPQAVEVWDIATGQLIRPLHGTTQAEIAIQGFLTTTNSSLVVAGSINGRVITWDASTGDMLHDFAGERIFSLAAVAGTNQILTAHSDNLLRVKDSSTGTTLRTISGHGAGAILATGFSPDRQYVVSSGTEPFIRVWNRTNAEQVRAFPASASGTQTASFSPDGKWILTTFGAPTFSAGLLNVETGAIDREFLGHTSWPSDAVFTSDGGHVATVAQDGTARLWDVATGRQVGVFSSPGSLLTSVAVSSNGTVLASGASDGTVQIRDAATGKLLRTLQLDFPAGSITSLAFSPATGELLVAWADGLLRTFDPETGAVKLDSLSPAGFLYAAVFSPDGRFILDAEGWPSFSARLWDAITGEELRVFSGHAGEVNSVAFDPTGTSILTGADIVRLWSIADIIGRPESERTPNGLELRWQSGTLQQSAHVNGPWFDVTNAVSPWVVSTDQPCAFFRTRAATN